jgi:hypothetical protein
MTDIAARDGPLLIFCQLGQLAVAAVPLNLSGLKPKDIVWDALGQLRELVNGLRDKNTGKDR